MDLVEKRQYTNVVGIEKKGTPMTETTPETKAEITSKAAEEAAASETNALLREQLAVQKKQLLHARIVTILLVCIIAGTVAAAAVYIPKISQFMTDMDRIVTDLDDMIPDFQKVIEDLGEIGDTMEGFDPLITALEDLSSKLTTVVEFINSYIKF